MKNHNDLLQKLYYNYVVAYNSAIKLIVFTFAGVAVDIARHHCGCWHLPGSELCPHTIEQERETGKDRGKRKE